MTNFYFFSPTTMNEFLNEAKAGAKAWLVKAGTSLAVILLVVIGARVYSSSKSAESVIDNPTEEAITFKLDGKDYTLEPKTSQVIKLSKGEHSLEYLGETTKFTKKAPKFLDTDYSVINPTKSLYVLYNEIYWENLTETEAHEKSSTYDCEDDQGKPDKCPRKFLSDAFIQESVDYGLDEDTPENVDVAKSTRYTIKKKLFRKDDFSRYMDGGNEDVILEPVAVE